MNIIIELKHALETDTIAKSFQFNYKHLTLNHKMIVLSFFKISDLWEFKRIVMPPAHRLNYLPFLMSSATFLIIAKVKSPIFV